jgi:hypothetical protein
MLAMELIPAIRKKLAEADAVRGTAKASGYRAALWRSQQYAGRVDHTVEDLRRYCVESLMPRRFLEEDDYLLGYREGFQAVLEEVRRVEAASRET